jgi:hypothetical protein
LSEMKAFDVHVFVHVRTPRHTKRSVRWTTYRTRADGWDLNRPFIVQGRKKAKNDTKRHVQIGNGVW